MDRLRQHDLETARATPPEVKAEQALDAMRMGIELKWSALRTRYPTETEEQIDQRLLEWLARDD